MEKEIWKDIPDYKGCYQVSNLGRIKSLERLIKYRDGRKRRYPSVVIKDRDKDGFARVVTLKKNNKGKTFTVNCLVMLGFIGKPPKGYEICHNDGDYQNNKLDNLRYDIRSENRIDNYRYGRKASKGKLFIDDVLEIRNRYKNENITHKELSAIYGVNMSCIGKIIRKENFKWLNDDGTISESKTQIK